MDKRSKKTWTDSNFCICNFSLFGWLNWIWSSLRYTCFFEAISYANEKHVQCWARCCNKKDTQHQTVVFKVNYVCTVLYVFHNNSTARGMHVKLHSSQVKEYYYSRTWDKENGFQQREVTLQQELCTVFILFDERSLEEKEKLQ